MYLTFEFRVAYVRPPAVTKVINIFYPKIVYP